MQNPLVSERLELSVLYKEYAEDDNIYQQKIKVGAWPRGRKSPGCGNGSRPASDLLLAGPGPLEGRVLGAPLVTGSEVCGLWNQRTIAGPSVSLSCGVLVCKMG